MTEKHKTLCPRRRRESRQAYEAVNTYLALGVYRSIAKAAKILGKSTAMLERWSGKFKWVKRAGVFDAAESEKRWEAHKLDIVRAFLAARYGWDDRAGAILTDEEKKSREAEVLRLARILFSRCPAQGANRDSGSA